MIVLDTHVLAWADNDERKIESLRQGKLPIYEPGLDPLVQQTFNGLMFEAKADGRTIFLS